jgi:hypothetical protein
VTQSTRTPRRHEPAPRDEGGLEDTRRTPLAILGRAAIVVMVLGIVLMWIYAFFGTHEVPGRLADKTFPTAAQPICQATLDKIEALPKANETPTPAQRADVVDQGTGYLDQMLADLRGKVPAAEPEHGIVTQWLDDWGTYVQDRRDYTAQLRVDATVRFAVTQSDRDKTQITKGIDHFADVNFMAACAVPDDLG